jgi:glycosyltransferase involved in cell wall biosynthesis
MIRVFVDPDYSKNPSETGGIRRVVDAKVKYFPRFGIEVVHNPDEAEIIINNGACLTWRPGIPMLNVNHGLYWSRQPWGDGFQEVNERVIESMCRSVAHTVPSKWVAESVRRGGLFYPHVVYHGVEADEFTPSNERLGYALWNKARTDYVSDPTDMQKLGQLLPGRRFVSTFGRETPNVKVIGAIPYSEMGKLVSRAGVYLSTARETFGIGTLEAMACGIPVAGWDAGGNSEIVVHGETGYLAPWGDFKALAECVERCYAEQDRLSANCVADVRARWGWEPRIKQYADILKEIYDRYYGHPENPKVSVIVTAYKLDKYLPACLQSIQRQSYRNFECLVVDDAQLVSTETIVRAVSESDPRFKYTPTPHNLKLSGARNYGFSKALGLLIRNVDADDILVDNALELEVTALDNDPGIHIVYGHLETFNEDGSRRITHSGQPERGGWPPEQFDWYGQMAHLNQLPSTVMVRREVYERSGGYRERMRRNEDAEFWCRVTSLGFRAKKVTQAVTTLHRERQDSKGATEWATEGGEPDWTAWFPWRIGAKEAGEGIRKLRERGKTHPVPQIVPFGAQGKPTSMRMWYVHDFAYPVVSVIVTCGPGHKGYLIDALDSVQAQTYPDWECIVVNDTGEAWATDFAGAPWAKVVNMNGNQGASSARNEGYKHAKGKYIIWLDADDYFLPWFLEKMVAQAENDFGVIFSDMIECKVIDGKEKFNTYRFPEFEIEHAAQRMSYPGTSVLIPRPIVEAMMKRFGGWDTEIVGMEDFSWQIGLHSLGFCAFHVPEPLFVYREYSTTKRTKDYARIDEILAYLDKKFYKVRKGEVKLCAGQDTS